MRPPKVEQMTRTTIKPRMRPSKVEQSDTMNRNEIENETTDTRIIRYNEQKRNLNETTKNRTDDMGSNKTENETITEHLKGDNYMHITIKK